jgi:hypothetical protein
MQDQLGNENAVQSPPPPTPDPSDAVGSVTSIQGTEVINTVDIPSGIPAGPMGKIPSGLPFDS